MNVKGKSTNKKGIFKITDLATYVCSKYFNAYKKEISSIKLQKTLYFLFAYWGGFVRKNNDNSNYVEEKIDLNEKLFDCNFEAWVYGPVIPEIFRKFRDNKLDYVNFDSSEMFDGVDSMVKESIDSLLDELFEISDFKLVSVSHEDSCWKQNFNVHEPNHNRIIPFEEIIEEYAVKQ